MRPSGIGSESHGATKRIRTTMIASLAAVIVIAVLAFALAGSQQWEANADESLYGLGQYNDYRRHRHYQHRRDHWRLDRNHRQHRCHPSRHRERDSSRKPR